MNKNKISLVDLFLTLILSIVFSGSGWYFIKTWAESRREAVVRTLVQTGPEREALPHGYLAELLGLSVDRPVRLHQIDLVACEKRLLASPLIAEAHLERLPPQGLLVDYVARRPLFRLLDVENGAVGIDGVLFPLSPFFTPKTLPELYVGADFNELKWGKGLGEREAKLFQKVNRIVEMKALKLAKVDVSRAFREKLGEREIILAFEEERTLAYVRCLPHALEDALERYLLLHERLGGEERVMIDLRLPDTALVKKGK